MKVIRQIYKLVFVLALICGFSACTSSTSSENDNTDTPQDTEIPSLNGYWTGTINFSIEFDFELDITQTGTRLSGTFIYTSTGNTWEYPLLSTSSINDNKVYINFDQPDYRTRLTGTVNSTGDAMQGTHTLNGVSYSNQVWQASR